MNVITSAAVSNLRRNKSRNILIGAAIMLTAFLLTVVPMIVFGVLKVQFAAVNKAYPTFHAMYRDVEKQVAEEMRRDDRLEKIGLREDPAYIVCPDSDTTILAVSCDDDSAELNRMELQEGKLPKKAEEIVVSEGFLKVMGLAGAVGDRITLPFQAMEKGGLGLMQEQEFVICGFTPDSPDAIEQGVYSVVVSEAFAKQIIPEGQHRYRVYVRMAGTERKTTEAIEAEIAEVGETYHIREDNIVDNSAYLMANYVDPAMYTGLVFLMAVIILAGIITIYSIYYVSMINKVQEYGRLRAVGATRRQIRKLVFREGFAVALLAAPIGLALGTAGGIGLVRVIIHAGVNADNMVAEYMKQVLDSKELSLVEPWILLLAAAVTLLTVYLSLLRPMQTAAKISAIEAIRYRGGEKKNRKKTRKGYEELNIGRLTASNLGRNRKRTAVTIVTLGITGIFFLAVATILSCMDPEMTAKNSIRGSIEVGLDFSVGDRMHPEKELSAIQQNNPLSEAFTEQVLAIDGVEAIEMELLGDAFLEEIEEEGEPMHSYVNGVNPEVLREMEAYVKEGSLASKKLKDGTGIILNRGYLNVYPEYKDMKVGDTIHLRLGAGGEQTDRAFEIVAYTDAPDSVVAGDMILPDTIVQGLYKGDTADTLHIFTKKGREQEVAGHVKALVEGVDTLEMKTYTEVYEQEKQMVGFMMVGCYGMLFIFGLIGILNLINTMINSVHIRRREIGMLQAIGMSGKQTLRMLQMEGMFYTAGTLIVSLGIGSIAGYLAAMWMKEEALMNVTVYRYPFVPAAVLVILIAVVQILITYLVNHNFKRASLIDRIRFSE